MTLLQSDAGGNFSHVRTGRCAAGPTARPAAAAAAPKVQKPSQRDAFAEQHCWQICTGTPHACKVLRCRPDSTPASGRQHPHFPLVAEMFQLVLSVAVSALKMSSHPHLHANIALRCNMSYGAMFAPALPILFTSRRR